MSIERLKGEYEDYTWGYGQNHLDFYEFQLHLVSLIPHSAIAKTVLLRSQTFSYVYACGKSTFKTTIKTKTTQSEPDWKSALNNKQVFGGFGGFIPNQDRFALLNWFHSTPFLKMHSIWILCLPCPICWTEPLNWAVNEKINN